MSAQYRACPECGDIRRLEDGYSLCQRCKGAGHLYRMMTAKELSASIEQNERDGYHFVAIKRALIRDSLLSAMRL